MALMRYRPPSPRKSEGVSLNALVLTFIAQGLGASRRSVSS